MGGDTFAHCSAGEPALMASIAARSTPLFSGPSGTAGASPAGTSAPKPVPSSVTRLLFKVAAGSRRRRPSPSSTLLPSRARYRLFQMCMDSQDGLSAFRRRARSTRDGCPANSCPAPGSMMAKDLLEPLRGAEPKILRGRSPSGFAHSSRRAAPAPPSLTRMRRAGPSWQRRCRHRPSLAPRLPDKAAPPSEPAMRATICQSAGRL